ncbi:hypothetical protein BSP109_02180 [Brevibacterium sp. Mu109]|uniref:hypothetical protein n=1 Tax=Brevibacterium sp. Mu109 TaxID=1255669 RepID=UPI000C3795E0|nr:hypothetical protein [Brevibacterium sp. Mu109]SMX87136.1 hypothetical protein BSP109_02180 [Brevibacterium sp. Mu109]
MPSSHQNDVDITGHTVITRADQLRIRQAMNRTPFSASPRVPIPYYSPVSGRSDPVTVTSIVAFLDGLSEVVKEQTSNAEDQRRRLHSLEADVEAFRRLTGSASAEVPR